MVNQPGAAVLCMFVGQNGSVSMTDMEDGTNTYHETDQGHFTLIVVEGAGNGGGGGEAEIGEVSK